VDIKLAFAFIKIIAKKIVDNDETVRFTILLPTKMVAIKELYLLSVRSKTLAARLLPFVASERSLILFAQEKAVSVAEKNPEKKTKTTIAISKGTEPSGIKILLNAVLKRKSSTLILYFY
jgi:hypothetical protein